jgi:Arc/MetJ-type ribon-helix-helix transcriptional regulator
MTIQLKPEQEHRIAEALRSGAYSSSDDVIDRALELLHEHDKWFKANREANDAKIRAGIGELERGEGIPEDELDTHFAQLKARTGADLIAALQASPYREIDIEPARSTADQQS